ncbi:MAG: hypothetical protein AB7G13_11610 [Lautropia sp.]
MKKADVARLLREYDHANGEFRRYCSSDLSAAARMAAHREEKVLADLLGCLREWVATPGESAEDEQDEPDFDDPDDGPFDPTRAGGLYERLDDGEVA